MKIAGFRTSRRAYDFLRCLNYFPEFSRLGHETRCNTEWQPQRFADNYFDYELDRLGEWCDILFTTVENLVPHISDKLLALRDKYGFKLVCDNDDPLSIVPPPSQPAVESLLRGADLVTFVGPALAEDYGHMTRRWLIQPTPAPLSGFDIAPIKAGIKRDKHNLVFMGWPYHHADLSMIRQDVEALLDSGDYRLVIIGVWCDWLDKYKPDTVVRVTHVQQWEKLIGFMKAIPHATAIVPIRADCQETRYNNNAKFLDYTLADIPMVVSDVPNVAFLGDGKEACKVTGSWAEAVESVAGNDITHRKLRHAARERLLADFTVEKQAEPFLNKVLAYLSVPVAQEAKQS